MMSAIRHTEKTIFLEAVEIASAAERATFLDQTCGDDRQLRASIEALLRSHYRSQGLLDDTEIPFAEQPGTIIGPYKLLQQIGEGGMGVVYMAEQTQPVRRKVALKLIKPGMDSRQIIARFEAERQALAMMDHVNIARVLDTGATEAGRPYFVMELVHGVPITKYCDDNQLTPRQRLELFVLVCQAIQHAHQKGIIHRDIKPSNVMITLYDGKPVPKVIDFGVAKATEHKLTERTLFTHYGTMVGTLEYMSPEQAEMSALGVDTRCDIYSLGVLLYELLTGTTPLSRKRVRKAAYGEVVRMITEEEPPKPSTRLLELGRFSEPSRSRLPSGTEPAEGAAGEPAEIPARQAGPTSTLASISAQRQMEPTDLTKLVRGELDWIVMKTLEKDRDRRYETVGGLADDVQRYLNDEMVQACPPSAGYRLRKFVRRNKGPVLAVMSLVLVLAGGVIGTTWGLVLLDRARETADRHRLIAEERADVLRGHVYVANMNQAFKHLEQGEIEEVLAILDKFELPAERQSFEWRYLRSLAGNRPRQLAIFLKHTATPFSAVFAPDGRTVASCAADRCIRIWDASTGQEERVLRPRPETVSDPTSHHKEDENCVRFSPDGHQLFSACEDGTVRLWNLMSGTWKALSPKHDGEVLGLAMSSDGKLLAAAGVDRIVRIWTAADQVLVAELTGHQDTIQGLAFSRDGRSIASADHSGLVILWDVVNSSPRVFVRSGNAVFGVDYSPDGKLLATGEGNGVVRLWDATTGGELRELGSHFHKVRNVQFSPDGRLIASGSDDGRVRIWHVHEGTLAVHFRAHFDYIWSVAFSSDSRRLVTVSTDQTARVWDLRTLGSSTHWAATRDIPVSQMAFAPRSPRLAMSSADGRIMVGNAAARGSVESLQQGGWGHSTLTFSPDERRIIFIHHDQSVQSWMPAEQRTESIFLSYPPQPPGTWSIGSHAIHLLYPVDQPLTAVYWDGLLRTWEGDRTRERRITSPNPTGLSRPLLTWSSRARLAFHYPDVPGIGRLDLKTGAPSPEIPATRITYLALSPSGNTLAVVHLGAFIKLINWERGEEYRTLAGVPRPTSAIIFSNDERTLIGACGDGSIRLWHVETGQELFTLTERSGVHPTSMVLSADGSLLAVAGEPHEDGSAVTLYDIGTVEHGPFHSDPVNR
jgi:WD40 repeat protein/serine/threonine protein kinase